MPIVKHEEFISAPVEVVFDLARSVDIHIKTTGKSKEIAIGGVTEGLLEEGDMVTWEATHFGIRQRLTAKIISMDKPNEFVDIMVRGAFHSFRHTHQFFEIDGGTKMVDIFDYRSPFGFIGVLADKWFLEKYMATFIRNRARELKKFAEEKGDE
ncbi:SRPBCC family protein [Ornithinibacillus halotolerans]|uniref:Cell division protein n=1 Tax=Ornithinibacillus halotolerans TaxID=1274357 RepID=A0A916WBW4_9BACI|nr:SRPBCC family protein [Ornithinibacillus halotolerans]GGA85191.1 hypothetical protein GCM10008025_30290 [Ornithinibacillus halotolerans]